MRAHCNPLHPKHKFNIGNLESLKEIPKQKGLDVHEEIKKFYDQHYSANIMKLAVLGRGT
jgi:insulysin